MTDSEPEISTNIFAMLTIISLCLLLLFSAPVAAQHLPCPKLNAVQDAAIAYKQRGNRCEGFYEMPVAGESLNLVSLLYGSINFKSKSDLVINRPKGMRQQVHVKGVGIPLKTRYQLDAWLSPGEKLTWPLEIVKRMHLSEDKIGIFGQLIHDPEIHVPLYIGNNANSLPLNVIVRSTVDIDQVLWRMSRMKGQQCSVFEDTWLTITPNFSGYFFKGEAVKLALPEQKENFCLEFAAQKRSLAKWLKLLLKIQFKE